ncbi:MAG: serine/threonine protein kinase [Dehalococcoidia bacterium]|nr:serine/threonine protein kinase [Dehalococcoidia bacterium]
MSLGKLGRYELLGEIGRGAMGVVFRAHDPRFDREVAIKLVPPAALTDPTLRARFDREARAIARLEHGAIVPVYDVGEQDGTPYLVMRFMRGGSLAERLTGGCLDRVEVVRIVNRVALGLDAAHAAGVVHRDVKPQNVLFDMYDEAHLSDFGIATLLESGATLTGAAVIGTPTHMSPEQAKGTSEVGPASDVYSLGVLAFQLLSGRALFVATNPLALLRMHVEEEPPSLAELHPGLPESVAAAVTRALVKDPALRWRTAGEFATALQAAVDGFVPTPSIARNAPSVHEHSAHGRARQTAPPVPGGPAMDSPTSPTAVRSATAATVLQGLSGRADHQPQPLAVGLTAPPHDVAMRTGLDTEAAADYRGSRPQLSNRSAWSEPTSSRRRELVRPLSIKLAVLLSLLFLAQIMLSTAMSAETTLAEATNSAAWLGVVVGIPLWWLWRCKRWAAVALTVMHGIGLAAMLLFVPFGAPSSGELVFVGAFCVWLIACVALTWHPASRAAYRQRVSKPG